MLDVSEIDEPRTIWIFRREPGSDVDGEARLADPAGPAQGERSCGAGDPAHLTYFTFAADKGIKLFAGITVNTQFHVVARLCGSGQFAHLPWISSQGNVRRRQKKHQAA
ncbi:MAG TPA: hypothetical protein VF162_03110 [Streptosporangiaceae bacterium]